MSSFSVIAFTPLGLLDPSIAIAASRAGDLGILNVGHLTGDEAASNAVESIARLGRSAKGQCGIRIEGPAPEQRKEQAAARAAGNWQVRFRQLMRGLPDPVEVVILTAGETGALGQTVSELHQGRRRVLLEVTSLEQGLMGAELSVDGLIAKGQEAGGWIGEETTFILLQRLLAQTALPVWAQGGIGLHTAAACYAAGAAGVVLDAQLALTRESPLAEGTKAAIAAMDGSETAIVGSELGMVCRVYARPGLAAVQELRRLSIALAGEGHSHSEALAEWREAVESRLGWGDPREQVWPLGQDAALAAPLARRYGTVGGVVGAIRESARTHSEAARALQPLDEGSPLAHSHNTRYPIVQGPMTWVSDRAEFALRVAEEGGLPLLALASLRAPAANSLLGETQRLLGSRPWGVGILGTIPPDLRQEQLEVVLRYRPPFALSDAGQPDQARALEKEGIATYLHVSSPDLLRLSLQDGARRFVFEGHEAGGHVGPRSSFVLWDSMVDILLEELPASEAASLHLLFAGGIHDALSASMAVAVAAPLAERGARVGVLLGTAYLFTEEAVQSGAILPAFQREAQLCQETVVLEADSAHAIRCARTPFVDFFEQEKERLLQAGRSASEVRHSLDDLSLERLRIATKGITHHPRYGQDPDVPDNIAVDEEERRSQGMHMIGQLAALRDRTCTIEELHRSIAVDGSRRLEGLPIAAEAAPASTAARGSQIAIVGMSAILPKAPNLQQYWENILNQVYAITEVAPTRWESGLYYHPDRFARDKVYSKWGGFIDDLPFDPMEFGMPPNSMRAIDPMHLLALLAAREALADAGYARRPFDRSRTSVILGASGGVGDLGAAYVLRSGLPQLFGDAAAEIIAQAGAMLPEWTEDSFAGLLLNVVAGRIANRLDLGGLNYVVDAACASSLAAVHAAVRELETYTTDMAIAGGVDTVQNPFGYLCFSKTQALSPTGEPRVFDATADGIVIGEGVAMMVLKRLADAERDGDRIYAVIRGLGGSSDGRAMGLTAPRPEGQMLALERAYAKAGFSPTSAELFEAHGTGTVVGDRAEALALASFLEKAGAAPQTAGIGSVKSMIGHTKATAGVAGLAKAALALYHRILPPTWGVKQPNPKARFGESPLYVNSETRPWIHTADTHPRRAGVSAFGFGGTNFHAVLEEYTDDYLPRPAPFQHWPSELLLFSAPSPQELLSTVAGVEQALEQGARPELRDLAYTLSLAFEAQDPAAKLCLAIVATSLDDLHHKLAGARRALAGHPGDDAGASAAAGAPGRLADPRGIYFSDRPLLRQGGNADGSGGRIAFLFPGQGSQYPNMVRDLAVAFPEVRETFERADKVVDGRFSKRLSAFVFPPPPFVPEEEEAQNSALTQTNVAQPALGVASIALFRLLRALGLEPDMTAGHSYGEYVALSAAGVIDEQDLVRLSEARGRSIIEAAQEDLGTMAAVQADAQAIAPIVEPVDGVWIANLNAPTQTIISGTKSGVALAMERLKANGLNVRPIPVACAFHSPLVAPAQQRLAEVLPHARFSAPGIQVYSNTTAAPYPRDVRRIRELLTEHLIRPVRFTDEIEAMYEGGARVFVEVGPRSVLTGLTGQILGARPHLAVAVDQPGRSGLTQLQHALGLMAAHGAPLRLERLFRGRNCRHLDLEHLVEATREKPLSATTWLVNGGRARPMRESGGPPYPRVPLSLGAPAADPAPASRPGGDGRGEPAVPASPVTASATLPVVEPVKGAPAPAGSSDERDQVVLQFQRVMDRFLETQRNVMLAYLKSTPPAPLPTGDQEEVPAQWPADRPEPRLAEPQRTVPLAVAAAEEARHQALEQARPAKEPESPLAGDHLLDREALTARLLDIVSERTGYPADMLDQNLDLEAGLGIDSIKRVEILGRLRQSLAGNGRPLQDLDMERLSRLKTLREIIDLVLESGERAAAQARGQSPAQAALPIAETRQATAQKEGAARPEPEPLKAGLPMPAGEAGRGDGQAEPATSTRRSAFRAVDRPLSAQPGGLAAGHVVLITDDGMGVAHHLSARLQEQGYPTALLCPRGGPAGNEPGAYEADLNSPEEIERVLGLVRQAHGPIGGLLHLLPLLPHPPFETMDLPAWRERLTLEVRTLFLLAKAVRPDLEAAAMAGGATLVAASRMGGTFANELGADAVPLFPGQGAITGFLKSVAKEWPSVRVKAVDLDPRQETRRLAEQIVAEALAEGEVEVGYPGGRRIVLEPALSPYGDEPSLAIGEDWVILVTGGARGITADVARELAERYRPTLLLAAKSPLPEPEESPATVGLTEPGDLKAAIIARLRASGQPVALPQVERAYDRLLKDREIRENMAAMVQAGARVHYYPVDVRDEQDVGALIDRIYGDFGRLDGVIHGAGIIEDKLVKDKAVESFDRVFGTKVDSAFILSRRLRAESLKFLVLFSSVAGHFGNRGQSDYGAANEVLDKLAIELDRRWPARVVSIVWGAWNKRGMVSPELQRDFARRGIELIPPVVGRRWLADEIQRGRKGEAEILIAGERGADLDGRSSGPAPVPPYAGPATGEGLPLLEGGLHAPPTPLPGGEGLEMIYELNPARDRMLDDHRLDGNAVLPAAEAIELMAETVKMYRPNLEIARLRDIRVQRGIILRAGPEAVRISARASEPAGSPAGDKRDGGQIRQIVDVEISEAGPAQRPYYRATFDLADQLPPPPRYEAAYTMPLQPFAERIDQAYEKYLFHGPALHCIAEVEGINREGIVARVTPASPAEQLAWRPQGQWLIDPVVLDGGFQLAIVWARIMHDITPLPSRFRAYHRYGPLTGPAIRCLLYSHAEVDTLIMHTTLFFVTPDGRVMGSFEGAESTCSSRPLIRTDNERTS